MKFNVEKQDLKKVVSLSKVFLDKSLDASTEMVKLEAKDGFVVITAITFSKGCKMKLEADVSEKGMCVIDGSKLGEISNCMTGEEIFFSLKGNNLLVQDSSFKFNLNTGNPELFLSWPDIPDDFIEVDSRKLNTILDSLKFATVPSGDFSGVVKSPLYGIIFFKGCTAIATDTTKMAVLRTHDIGEFAVDISMFPIFKSLKEETVGVSSNKSRVFLKTVSNIFFFNSVNVERPPVEKLLGSFDYSKEVTHYRVQDTRGIVSDLKKLSVFDNEIVLWCKKEGITMGSFGPFGEALTTADIQAVSAEGISKPFVIKNKSLLLSLGLCESVDLFVFSIGQIVIKSGDYLSVIMPKLAADKVRWMEKGVL